MMKLENKTNVFIAERRQLFATQIANVHIVDYNFTFVCQVKRSEDMQQSTFACTGRTGNADNFPLFNADVHSF